MKDWQKYAVISLSFYLEKGIQVQVLERERRRVWIIDGAIVQKKGLKLGLLWK